MLFYDELRRLEFFISTFRTANYTVLTNRT